MWTEGFPFTLSVTGFQSPLLLAAFPPCLLHDWDEGQPAHPRGRGVGRRRVQPASFPRLSPECRAEPGIKPTPRTGPEKLVFCWGEAQMESWPWKWIRSLAVPAGPSAHLSLLAQNSHSAGLESLLGLAVNGAEKDALPEETYCVHRHSPWMLMLESGQG